MYFKDGGEFKTGDCLEYNVSTLKKANGGAFFFKFKFTVWYVAEVNTVYGTEGCWVDETAYAPIQTAIDKINAIDNEVTLESKEGILDARNAYNALTQRQKYLVLCFLKNHHHHNKKLF